MRAAWLQSLIIFRACIFAAAPAHAQPLFPHAESIESLVANSDLVFIAKLEKVSEAERADGREVHQVTIAIEDTLKQDLFCDPYERLSTYAPGPASVLEDWTKRSCRLLVTLDSDAPRATRFFELEEGKLEIFTADLTLLRKPDEVIQAAREAARQMPSGVKRIHTFKLKVPRELAADTQWEPYYHTSGHLVLSVPADDQLQKRALGYLRSDDYQQRAEGAKALRFFKSDENVARLKPLLDDPARYLRHHAEEGRGREAIYIVRYAAYETLKAWQIDVEQPVLREDVRE